MSIESTTITHPNYLQIVVKGDYSLETLYGFLAFVKAETARLSVNRVMIDARNLRGKMTEADRFLGGQKIAELFGRAIRCAILMPEGEVTKLGEIAAVNRGARLLVTEVEAEAVNWLNT